MSEQSTAEVRAAVDADLDRLAALAARTFPLACPPALAPEHVAAFVAQHLSREAFCAHLSAADDRVLVTEAVDGYALSLHAVHADQGPVEWRGRRSAYLSKLYVDPAQHGRAVADALMSAVLEGARTEGCQGAWLGVNRENHRALRFYAKVGFQTVGEREFQVGGTQFVDDVLVLPFA